MSSYRQDDRELHLGLASAAKPMEHHRISSEGNHPLPLISKLGDDLLVEILIRGLLNPRFACRSKLVCKQWSSLISSPCFHRRFVSHLQSRSAGDPPLTPASVASSIPLPDEIRGFSRVLHSFKDLLLCGFLGFDVKTDGELARSYLICNPFTKQWIALPLAPEKSAEEYDTSVARLVCQPRISLTPDLEHGQAFVYSEYRFRVVCIYTLGLSTKVDVFCSESGEWYKEALVFHGYLLQPQPKPKSCDGKLFWAQYGRLNGAGNGIVELNPFCLDAPPTVIYDAAIFRRPARSWGFSVSHGCFHLIKLETETTPGCSRNALIVWRLEDDRRTWTMRYEVLLKTTWSNYVSRGIELDLHPERPETALLTFGDYNAPILSCDLRSGELERFSTQRTHTPGWMLFQPRVSCWPTPIPRYEELRGLYDGRYSCWVQRSSNESTTSSVTVAAPVDGVEQFGHQRKDNISRIVMDAFGLEEVRQTIRDLHARLANLNERIYSFIVQDRAATLSDEAKYDLEICLAGRGTCTRQLQIAVAQHEVISRAHRNLPVDPMYMALLPPDF